MSECACDVSAPCDVSTIAHILQLSGKSERGCTRWHHQYRCFNQLSMSLNRNLWLALFKSLIIFLSAAVIIKNLLAEFGLILSSDICRLHFYFNRCLVMMKMMLVVKSKGTPLTVKVSSCIAKLQLLSRDPTRLEVCVGEEGRPKLGWSGHIRYFCHVDLQAVILARTATLLYLLKWVKLGLMMMARRCCQVYHPPTAWGLPGRREKHAAWRVVMHHGIRTGCRVGDLWARVSKHVACSRLPRHHLEPFFNVWVDSWRATDVTHLNWHSSCDLHSLIGRHLRECSLALNRLLFALMTGLWFVKFFGNSRRPPLFPSSLVGLRTICVRWLAFLFEDTLYLGTLDRLKMAFIVACRSHSTKLGHRRAAFFLRLHIWAIFRLILACRIDTAIRILVLLIIAHFVLIVNLVQARAFDAGNCRFTVDGQPISFERLNSIFIGLDAVDHRPDFLLLTIISFTKSEDVKFLFQFDLNKFDFTENRQKQLNECLNLSKL